MRQIYQDGLVCLTVDDRGQTSLTLEEEDFSDTAIIHAPPPDHVIQRIGKFDDDILDVLSLARDHLPCESHGPLLKPWMRALFH